MFVPVVLVLLVLSAREMGLQGMDVGRGDEDRSGRQLLLQQMDDETISLTTYGCDPGDNDGRCGPSKQDSNSSPMQDSQSNGNCDDILPEDSELSCSQYVSASLCGLIDEQYCQASCNRCPKVCEERELNLITCADIVSENKCNEVGIFGEYCNVSCGVCSRVPSLTPQPKDDAASTIALSPMPQLAQTPNITQGTLLKELTDFKELQDLLGLGQIGTVPKEISVLTNLEILKFYNDVITGTVPKEISVLTKLELLYLYDTGGLTGTIPRELSVLTNLVDLRLGGNSLTGTIPTELSTLANIEDLSLSRNNLIGKIPDQLSSLTALTLLSLRTNQLTGTIPNQLFALTNLDWMNLSRNRLTGTIPSQLSAVTNLESMYLYNNRLTGIIPKELSALTKLENLRLENNNLTGTLPREFSVLTSADIKSD